MKNINLLANQGNERWFCMLVIVFFLFSCNENVLDEKPLDFLSSENAYNTPEDIEMGINALHADVRDWFTKGNGNTYIMTALGTDEGYYGEDPGASELLCNYPTCLTPSTTDVVDYYWGLGYTLIQKINVLLEAVDNMDESNWPDSSDKNAALAEARFFRAFAYRMLVTLFGDIPKVDKVIDYAKTDFVRDSKTDIYGLIESDLTFAAENLPSKGNESASGRITQGAAWHLLSEIYLAEGKYQLAADAASHVINDYGYALMTNRFGAKSGNDIFKNENVYFDLFTKENHNLSENTEAIWVIQIDYGITGGGQNGGERYYTPAYFRMGNTPDGFKAIRGELYNGSYTGYSDTLGRGVACVCPTSYIRYKIWQSDWENDYRNSEACIKRNFYFDNPASAYDGQKIDWSLYPAGKRIPLKDTCQYLFPYFMKVASPCEHYTDLGRSGGGYNHKDMYAFRLAETYLLRAEAYLGLGNKDKAAADINTVRSRSNAKPVPAADVTIDYILDERARELYTEEWRMITLMRLGKLVERVRKYNDDPVFPGLNIQDHNNLWPIPQNQIDLNINAEMEQNPGYN